MDKDSNEAPDRPWLYIMVIVILFSSCDSSSRLTRIEDKLNDLVEQQEIADEPELVEPVIHWREGSAVSNMGATRAND